MGVLGAVGRVDGEPEPGATVELVGSSGEFLARGAWSPASQIRARVWSFEASEVIDAAFFRRRLARAVESRRRLELARCARRVPARVLRVRRLAGPHRGPLRRVSRLSVLVGRRRGVAARRSSSLLAELCDPRGIYERSEGGARHKEGLPSRRGLLAGEEPPAELAIAAGGVRLVVDIANGQKTGAYLDQQRNRERVARARARRRGARCVLVHRRVRDRLPEARAPRCATLIDSSPDALRSRSARPHRTMSSTVAGSVVANVFDELRVVRDAGTRFDLVVLDPPKFVHSADQVSAGSRG